MNLNEYDTRDAAEHADVSALLAALPADDPVREAYARGVGTLELTHLVADQSALVTGLKEAWLAGYRRLLAHSQGFRPR